MFLEHLCFYAALLCIHLENINVPTAKVHLDPIRQYFTIDYGCNKVRKTYFPNGLRNASTAKIFNRTLGRALSVSLRFTNTPFIKSTSTQHQMQL